MKSRKIAFVVVLSMLLVICTGCTTGVAMPYSSNEYKEMNWSVEELIAHFEKMGFSDIKTDVRETFDENQARICRVAIEDTSADSWFTEYKDFEKGEEYGTHLEVYISAYTLIPTLTVENCSEFAEYVKNGKESPDNTLPWLSFIKEHNGEALEFDGTITSWYDEFWYISGVDCTVAVEDSEHMSFCWDADSVDELGLDHNEYHLGLFTEGMKVHVLAVINYSEDDGLTLKIETMETFE